MRREAMVIAIPRTAILFIWAFILCSFLICFFHVPLANAEKPAVVKTETVDLPSGGSQERTTYSDGRTVVKETVPNVMGGNTRVSYWWHSDTGDPAEEKRHDFYVDADGNIVEQYGPGVVDTPPPPPEGGDKPEDTTVTASSPKGEEPEEGDEGEFTPGSYIQSTDVNTGEVITIYVDEKGEKHIVSRAPAFAHAAAFTVAPALPTDMTRPAHAADMSDARFPQPEIESN